MTFSEFFKYQLDQLYLHVSRAVEDVGKVIGVEDAGKASARRTPALAVQLRDLLEDDDGFTKTTKVHSYLKRAETVLAEGLSEEPDLASWLNGKASEGIVCITITTTFTIR